MFIDKRSKKVIFVAHCVLNQNTKLDQCAHYPGVIREVMEFLISKDVGIIQMPCPEMLYLGLNRQADVSTSPTVESEDTRIFKRMLENQSQNLCMKLINNIVYQIKEYKINNFEVIGLVGINGSPTCGIETTWTDGTEIKGNGIFIKMLNDELQKNNIFIKMSGIKANDAESAVRAIEKIFFSV